jgi:iron-sulfur cluster repair protein YtfE (RIC family)
MKRSEALAELSRDHHQALFVAQRLRRAGPETAVAAREAFLEFWATEGRRHFRDEEEILLPAFARHEPPTHEAVVRVLTDHIDLRRRAGGTGSTPSLDELRELGERLHAHVRHEERVLFPMIEAALSTDELVELAASLVSTQASTSR